MRRRPSIRSGGMRLSMPIVQCCHSAIPVAATPVAATGVAGIWAVNHIRSLPGRTRTTPRTHSNTDRTHAGTCPGHRTRVRSARARNGRPLVGAVAPNQDVRPSRAAANHDRRRFTEGDRRARRLRERQLFARYRGRDDLMARDELVAQFLPLATRLAQRYRRGAEPLEDLVQVASVGLLNAIDRFDPERGTAFLVRLLCRRSRRAQSAISGTRVGQSRFRATSRNWPSASTALDRSPHA